MLSFKEIRQLEKSKKARDTQGLFVTEGRKLFEEAPPEEIVQVLVTARFARAYPDLMDRIPSGADVVDGMEDSRFASLTDTRTPQGILTVMRQQPFSAEETLQKPDPLFVLLEDLQDPGNAGTILRTGEAAGVDAVFLTEGSADLTSPKAVRATMGSVFRVPHIYISDAKKLLAEFRARSITSFCAHLEGSVPYTQCDYTGGTVFLIGNEGRGITPELAQEADRRIRIPMQGQVESLNAAMAAGILLYEAGRQRAAAGI